MFVNKTYVIIQQNLVFTVILLTTVTHLEDIFERSITIQQTLVCTIFLQRGHRGQKRGGGGGQRGHLPLKETYGGQNEFLPPPPCAPLIGKK